MCACFIKDICDKFPPGQPSVWFAVLAGNDTEERFIFTTNNDLMVHYCMHLVWIKERMFSQ